MLKDYYAGGIASLNILVIIAAIIEYIRTQRNKNVNSDISVIYRHVFFLEILIANGSRCGQMIIVGYYTGYSDYLDMMIMIFDILAFTGFLISQTIMVLFFAEMCLAWKGMSFDSRKILRTCWLSLLIFTVLPYVFFRVRLEVAYMNDSIDDVKRWASAEQFYGVSELTLIGILYLIVATVLLRTLRSFMVGSTVKWNIFKRLIISIIICIAAFFLRAILLLFFLLHNSASKFISDNIEVTLFCEYLLTETIPSIAVVITVSKSLRSSTRPIERRRCSSTSEPPPLRIQLLQKDYYDSIEIDDAP